MEFPLAKLRLKVLKDFFPYYSKTWTPKYFGSCALAIVGKRWEVIAAASSDDKLEVCKKATLH